MSKFTHICEIDKKNAPNGAISKVHSTPFGAFWRIKSINQRLKHPLSVGMFECIEHGILIADMADTLNLLLHQT